MLQIFIFLYEADRHPSTFQLLSAFGSLVFLAYSRVESITLERGGHRMSPGRKFWWIVRYLPYNVINCGFKLVSMSLFLVIFRFNCIWLYGGVFLIWFIIQHLFNERCLPLRFYYLFQGAGIHCVREGSEIFPLQVFNLSTFKKKKNNKSIIGNFEPNPIATPTFLIG